MPNHQCVAGKAHCIEIFSDKEEKTNTVPPTEDAVKAFYPMGGALAALRGVPKYLTLRVRGTIMGQRVSVLVDSGATYNFIDTQLVQRRGIHIEHFENFSVLVPGARTMQCAKYVPALTITTGTYTLTDHFFVVDILDTNVILGV